MDLKYFFQKSTFLSHKINVKPNKNYVISLKYYIYILK